MTSRPAGTAMQEMADRRWAYRTCSARRLRPPMPEPAEKPQLEYHHFLPVPWSHAPKDNAGLSITGSHVPRPDYEESREQATL